MSASTCLPAGRSARSAGDFSYFTQITQIGADIFHNNFFNSCNIKGI